MVLDQNEYIKYKKRDIEAVPRSYEDVRAAYRDFLAFLYGYIVQTFQSTNLLYGTSWRETKVEFMFTVPTTWTALGVTNTFEALVREAGFGSDGAEHSVSVGLTEAEAAAVHTFASQSSAYVVRRAGCKFSLHVLTSIGWQCYPCRGCWRWNYSKLVLGGKGQD